MKQFGMFVLVGLAGLGADYLSFVLIALLLPAELARLFSFLIAVNVTFALNKRVTFANGQARYGWYVLGQAKGFVLNYLVFTVSLMWLKTMPWEHTVAFLAGSAVALFFNFAYAKYVAMQ